MAAGRAIGVIGKAPQVGTVKTRLIPPLDPWQATVLYRAMLRDALLTAVSVPNAGVSLVYPSPEDLLPLAELLPPDVSLMQQTGTGLGDAMLGAFRNLWAAGASSVVLIGADLPTLPVTYVEDAFAMLESGEHDVVLGPADDGGYYLIGLRDDYPELFEGIAWSTARVLRQTLERAHSAGLCVAQLPRWYDVDDLPALARLVTDLAGDPHLHAPATRAALQTLRRFGAPLPDPPIPWRVLRTERRYEGPWRNFDADLLVTHAGEEIDYTYLSVPDAVWVVPVTPEGEIVFVRQYRHPVRDWCLEVPAGGVTDEGAEASARRELREEIGASVDELRLMGAFYPASAHLTERGYVYLALDVQIGETDLEATEMLVPIRVSARIAFDMARHGEISDAQSALALLVCEQAIGTHLGR